MNDKNFENAILGGGCFWCVEAVFERIDGVSEVISGYAGGHTKNPTYKEVITGRTGHAEVCKIVFDPKEVTYDEILDVFGKPTTQQRLTAKEMMLEPNIDLQSTTSVIPKNPRQKKLWKKQENYTRIQLLPK